MKKLHELLGTNPQRGLIGLEIEAEGDNMREHRSDFWHTEDDGSLRGEFPNSRAEFVLNAPILAKDVPVALDELIASQKDAEFDFSFRTSVHVHVNCDTMNRDEILAFIYLYFVYENVLMHYCGEGRQANRFCLRLRDAEYQIETVMKIASNERYLMDLNGDAIRYASMNLASLSRYGSVEFRGLRGNMDKEVILPWVGILIALRKKAIELRNPMAVHEYLASKPFEEIYNEVFGKYAEVFRYEGMERDYNEGISLSLQIPFEWKRLNVRKRATNQKVGLNYADLVNAPVQVDFGAMIRVRNNNVQF